VVLVDRHHNDADLDQDPTFHFNANPDPDPTPILLNHNFFILNTSFSQQCQFTMFFFSVVVNGAMIFNFLVSK
jgi:hypothetical protein